MLDFGRPSERPLLEMDVDEAGLHLAAGQFAEGSMAPKIRAAREFLLAGGVLGVVTTPDLVGASLAGAGAGTRVVPTKAAAADGEQTSTDRTNEEVAR
jgi:carbamate kinase